MRAAAVAQLERQVRWCRELGSPLYAGLLERAVADARVGGVVSELLAPWAGVREGDVPALRLLGAVPDVTARFDGPPVRWLAAP